MKILLITAVLLGVYLHPQNGYAQSSPAADKVQEAANNYYKHYPQEKLYVHTSQNAYTGGQTVWYKVYAMAYGKPSELSNIVYVNLTDLNGKPVIQNKRPLERGSANGDILLPDTLHTGWYQLQAYTAWMLNFKEDRIYQQKIYIKNLHDQAEAETPKITLTKYHIKFYPEGGDLVNGNKSNIAFKATDSQGQPATVTGEVILNDKNTGVKFVTAHDGMGSFTLETYTADKCMVNVHYPDNTTELIPLPDVKKTGTALHATANGEFVSLNMFYAGANPTENVIIMGMQANGLSSAYPIKLSRGNNLIRFKKGDYNTGIMRFTILNDAFTPLAERIVFISNNDELNMGLKRETVSFSAKANNKLLINVNSLQHAEKKANISVAVTDADMDAEGGENIMSGMLLSDEIKGRVNEPAYYFKNNSDTVQQHLDLVMLTNGWRHFKWEEILSPNTTALKYSPERTQFVAGAIENYNAKKSLKVKFIIANPNNANKRFENVVPDSAGRFAIDDNALNGVAKLYYNVVDAQNKKQALKLQFTSTVIDTLPVTTDSVSNYQGGRQIYAASALDTLKRQQQSADFQNDIVLKEVRIKALRKRPIDEVIADHVKTLVPDRYFDLDLINTPSLPTMNLLQYIQGRFPGLEVYMGTNGKTVFRYRGVSSLIEPSYDQEGVITPPTFYVNENQVEYDDVRDISMYDLALVRYAPPPVWFAPLGGSVTGALMLYTKNYKDHNIGGVDIQNFDLYNLKGYSISREFAEPNYADPMQLKKHDYRSTLYWSPNAKPDADGNIVVQFPNSDNAKHFRVTVQGMDNDGRLGFLSEVLR